MSCCSNAWISHPLKISSHGQKPQLQSWIKAWNFQTIATAKWYVTEKVFHLGTLRKRKFNPAPRTQRMQKFSLRFSKPNRLTCRKTDKSTRGCRTCSRESRTWLIQLNRKWDHRKCYNQIRRRIHQSTKPQPNSSTLRMRTPCHFSAEWAKIKW